MALDYAQSMFTELRFACRIRLMPKVGMAILTIFIATIKQISVDFEFWVTVSVD